MEYVSNTSPYDADALKQISVVCPEGKQLTGGGASVKSAIPNDTRLTIQESFPISNTTWNVTAVKQTSCNCDQYDWSVTSWAICVDIPAGQK